MDLETKRQSMVNAFKAYSEAPEHNRQWLWTDYINAREEYLKAAALMSNTKYTTTLENLAEYD